MDFLLECIGFPPDQDFEALVRLVRARGEPVAWRGPGGEHLRLPLGGGLDLRLDREEGSTFWSFHPHYDAPTRLRVAVDEVRPLPDSPFDALLLGRANPPSRRAPEQGEGYFLSCMLTDARRLPPRLERGHVLALALAAFAIDVERIAPEAQAPPGARARRFTSGGFVEALGGSENPGGCVELSLPVRTVTRLANPLTGAPITLAVCDAPGRPLPLFINPWQLDNDGLPAPTPGLHVSGTFLLTGRIAGGLATPATSTRSFG